MRLLLQACLVASALFCTCNALLGACSNTAWSQSPRVVDMTPQQEREQNLRDLRFMQREIAKMRYSEICATIKPPSSKMMAYFKSVNDAAEKGDPDAIAIIQWLEPVLAAYQNAKCGDA